MRAECWRLSVSEPCRSSQGDASSGCAGSLAGPAEPARASGRGRAAAATQAVRTLEFFGGYHVARLHDFEASSAVRERGTVSCWVGLVGGRGSNGGDEIEAARARAALPQPKTLAIHAAVWVWRAGSVSAAGKGMARCDAAAGE